MPEDKWAAGSITFLSVLNMAACVLLHMTGVLEFRNSVTFTHILMAMDILYLGYALVHYVKKHGMDRIAKTNIVGIIILLLHLLQILYFLCYFNCCGYSGKNRIPCLYLSAGMACSIRFHGKTS